MQTSETTYAFPLYVYTETNGNGTVGNLAGNGRTPNLDAKIVKRIAEKTGLRFTAEKEETDGTFAPVDVFDYVYAALHSPTCREKYKEFLKIDFPRVPYPKNRDVFRESVRLGEELRRIRLPESPKPEESEAGYPINGDNRVEKIEYENGRAYVNATQYFDKVPRSAWDFYVGGYQPARKWLKDRKGRRLEYDDILHYRKMIAALQETGRLMREIDTIELT